MAISLKDLNRPSLALVLLVNIFIYLAVLNNGFAIEAWVEKVTNIKTISPVLLMSILTGVLNAQISPMNKARLVFWKINDPLPASYAFSKHARVDPRIDISALQKLKNPLPQNPVDQNRLWYKWYQQNKNEPSIKQVHREYLFTRDYTGISFIFLLTLGPLAFWQMPTFTNAFLYAVVIILQYLLVRVAASNHGVRFVTSVLAIKSSQS